MTSPGVALACSYDYYSSGQTPAEETPLWQTLLRGFDARTMSVSGKEVGDERYNEAEIRRLYDSEAYPLKRHTKR